MVLEWYELVVFAFAWFPAIFCLLHPRLRTGAVLGPAVGLTAALTAALWWAAHWALQVYTRAAATQVLSLGSFAVFHLVWWPLVAPRLRGAVARQAAALSASVTPVRVEPGRGLGLLAPGFAGVYTPAALPDDILQRLARRVRSGLFPGASSVRNAYEVTEEQHDRLRFRSTHWLTSANVGLNDVTLWRAGDSLRYEVGMGAWTRFCVALGATIGVPCLVGYVLMAMLRPDGQHPVGPVGHVLVAGNIVFWCGLWPWVLTALHKPHAARALHRILDEEAVAPTASG